MSVPSLAAISDAPATTIAPNGVAIIRGNACVTAIAASTNYAVSPLAALCATVIASNLRIASSAAFSLSLLQEPPLNGFQMSEPDTAYGQPLAEWAALFRPGIEEFAATSFRFTRESTHLVRIAFGNGGPFIDAAGNRQPVYTHAVTLPPELALQLADLLLKNYAAPEATKGSTGSDA